MHTDTFTMPFICQSGNTVSVAVSIYSLHAQAQQLTDILSCLSSLSISMLPWYPRACILSAKQLDIRSVIICWTCASVCLLKAIPLSVTCICARADITSLSKWNCDRILSSLRVEVQSTLLHASTHAQLIPQVLLGWMHVHVRTYVHVHWIPSIDYVCKCQLHLVVD